MGVCRALFWEIKMDLMRTFRYRFGMITDIVVYFVLFTIFMITGSGTSYAETYNYVNYKEMLLIGYIAWIYAISAISNVTNSISSELIHGTMYKKLSSKFPLQYLFFGLFVSSILLETITIAVVVVVSNNFWGINMSFYLRYIFVLIIGTLGMYGIGLIVAGIAIYFKRTGSIVFLIQTALLFITDTVPTNAAILRFTSMIPLTRCNDVLKQMMIGQQYTSKLPGLISSSIIWLVIGSLTFEIMLLFAKKRGNLLFY
jgi:ABC-2 type transport system permease protein